MADYVSNKEFYNELVAHKEACEEAVSLGLEKPVIPNKIAHAILQICNRLSNSYNFVNYTFKDEMSGDAILKCISKVHLFDPTRTDNPFAYFTQIAWNSYVGRITTEQKATSIKSKLIANSMIEDYVEQSLNDDSETGNAYVTFLRENEAYVDYIEQRKQNKIKTGQLHPSLKHRNLTPYKKKEEQIQIKQVNLDSSSDLWDIE